MSPKMTKTGPKTAFFIIFSPLNVKNSLRNVSVRTGASSTWVGRRTFGRESWGGGALRLIYSPAVAVRAANQRAGV
jgi:hypothetical protein